MNNTPPSQEDTISPQNKAQATKRAHQSDLTQGNIWVHIYRIATPAIIGQVFNSLYNWVDTFWGGKISTDALAAFSVTFPIYLLAIAIGQCIGSGGMVMVSNALGAKKHDDANHFLKQTVLNATILGGAVLVLILLFSKAVLTLLGAEGQALTYGLEYINTLAFGLPFLILFFALNVALTSRGNTRFMRNILILNTLINLGLDPLLLYGLDIGGITIIPSLGIKGIALATVFVQVLGVVLLWIKIQRTEETHWKSLEHNKIHWPKFEWNMTKSLLKYGMPSFLQIGMAAIGLSVINFFMFRISGATAAAAYGIGLRIEQLALVPTIGIGMALSALVGQNNGAKQYLRVREAYVKTLIIAMGLWIVMMLPIALFGHKIAQIFTNDLPTVQITYFYLSFAFLAFMAYQLMGSSSGVLQAIKKPLVPIIILTARQLVLPWVSIPIFAYVLGWGIYGVFTSIVINAWICATVLLIIVLKTLYKKIHNQEE